jgi:hypothetical protein
MGLIVRPAPLVAPPELADEGLDGPVPGQVSRKRKYKNAPAETPATGDAGRLAPDIWIPIACGLSDGAGYIKFDLSRLNEAARAILWRGLALGLSGGPAEIEVRSSLVS